MNKRIKLKKGILHKKCDETCDNYRIIKGKQLVTNNICERCGLKCCDEVVSLLAKNTELYILSYLKK